MTVTKIHSPKLTIALMTRGRPEIARKTVQAMLPLIRRPSTRLMVLLDEDDKASVGTFSDLYSLPNLLISVKPREETRGEKYDRALTEAPADVYLPVCDYAPIITEGFDELVLEAASRFPDGIGCVYSEMANMSFPHYQAPTKKLVEKLGYIYPGWFPFWFIDHWLDDIARMIDRISYADIKCDASMFTGKTIGLRDLEFWTTLYDAGRNRRRGEALSIINGDDFQETWERKKLLAANFPLHEHRSFNINQGVRNNRASIERDRGGVESEPDERYKRIKAKAERLLAEWSASYGSPAMSRNDLMEALIQAAWNRDGTKVMLLAEQWKKLAA